MLLSFIAGAAQEILRKHNDPRRAASPAEAGPASLWHAMQQREDPGSDGSEGSEQATPLGQEPWLEDGSGGLFSSGHAPTRLPAWQHTQLGTAHVHNPRDGPGRQASQQEEESGEEVVGQQDTIELGVTEEAAAAGDAGRLKSSPVTGPDRSEPSNSMMGNLMSTMRRYALMVDSSQVCLQAGNCSLSCPAPLLCAQRHACAGRRQAHCRSLIDLLHVNRCVQRDHSDWPRYGVPATKLAADIAG